jgi:hypothetical protein
VFLLSRGEKVSKRQSNNLSQRSDKFYHSLKAIVNDIPDVSSPITFILCLKKYILQGKVYCK